MEDGLVKFITCGSVDDGKSTLIGHILYASKLLYADVEAALILESRLGSRSGGIDYSLLLDGLMAEREQGITIDVAYRYFTTKRRSFIVADAPGHEEYTRNMAVGASFADLAAILVDASRGVLTQTRRHARICALMGIHFFVFAVNKMDLIGYDKTRFMSISEEISSLQSELGIQSAAIIPVCATEGDNVIERSANMPWYSGKPLLEYLETVNISEADSQEGFYMPVQRVCRPDHTFRGFQGQVESGTVRVGDSLSALPSGEEAVVRSIYVAGSEAQSASSGQPATIQLDREVDVSRGCVLERGADLKAAKHLEATLLWMDDAPLTPGTDYWAKIGTRLIPAIVAQILSKTDINTGSLLAASQVVKNDLARCEIVLSEPAVIDEFRRHKTLGELILIDRVTHATSACGVIDRVNLESRISRDYPDDFDIAMASGAAYVRGGVLIGFGEHDSEVPLLELGGGDYGKFKLVCLWDMQSGLEYEI